MSDITRVLKVVLEYSPEQRRVMVRGAYPADTPAPANTQNVVRVFEGVDMQQNVGFVGLVPEGGA